MKKIPNALALALILIFANQIVAQDSPEPPPQAPADLASAPFRNPALPINQRVNDLVSRLTLEEKVAQMAHTAAAIPRHDQRNGCGDPRQVVVTLAAARPTVALNSMVGPGSSPGQALARQQPPARRPVAPQTASCEPCNWRQSRPPVSASR